MEQVAIQGANQVFITRPAGYASKDVSGSANIALGTSEGDADILEFVGVLTGNIVVTVPIPTVPMVKGTAPNSPVNTLPGWSKTVRNSTTGSFTLALRGPGGTSLLIPQGLAVDCYSKDGVDVVGVSSSAPDIDTATPQQTVTASYVVDTSQFDGTIFTNPAVGSVDITFPAASAFPGRELTVKDVTNGVGPLYYRVLPHLTDKIEGVNAPFPENTPLGSNTFQSNGVDTWWII